VRTSTKAPVFAGLQGLGTDPAAPLPPGTLPEALPEARVSVLLQNLGVAPNSVVVSGATAGVDEKRVQLSSQHRIL
jgi:hypothetical protein